jgi:processive 1,2-diacylglycerol beta-glucosyltransferase
MAPRILVLSASVGAGHLRAAEAVELAVRQIVPNAHVQNVDVLEMTNRVFRRVYGQFYLDLVNQAPHVLGYFYDLLDQPSSSGKYRTDAMRLLLEKANLRRFMKLLQEEKWDLAINTHFLPAEIIAHLKKKKGLELVHTTVTTDFETHRLWVNEPCERYLKTRLDFKAQ